MIIGLTGKMGTGKSTIIDLIEDLHPHRLSLNIKFAQPLYDMQEFIYRRIEGAHARPSTFIKDRKLLQWLGTEWGRNSISESLWIDIWKADVKRQIDIISHLTHEPIITCDDVRFDNEAEALKALGGILIQVTSKQTNDRSVVREGITGHASEKGVDSKYVDHVIENNGSINDLKIAIMNVMNIQKEE